MSKRIAFRAIPSPTPAAIASANGIAAPATRRLWEKYGAAFVPLQQVFDAACKRAEASYWLEDGAYPSPMGHELIKLAWIKAFEAMA